MSHNDLENYYKVNASMIRHHNFTIADLENLYPFERDIYHQIVAEQVKRGV